MKPKDQTGTPPPTPKPDESEAERFRNFAKQIVSVPKDEIDKRQAEWEKLQAEKKAAKKA